MDLYTESIRHLSLGERLELIRTIWDDIVSNDEQIHVPNSAIEEAKRRRDEMLVDPAVGLTHDEVWKKIKDARQFLRSIVIFLVIAAGVSVAGAAAQELAAEEAPAWIRGHGEELELRLSGEVIRNDGGNVEGAHLQIKINYDNRRCELFDLKLDGKRFQIWLPVNKHPWYSITVSATCRDGARCTKSIVRHELRELVVNGMNLTAQLPNRPVTVRLEHDGNDVAYGTVQAVLSNALTLKLKTDENGLARFNLLDDENLSQFTAWSQNQMIGGYQFFQTPVRDPRADSHVISMYRCRPFEVHLKDAKGQPIAGVELDFFCATPSPDYNYIGWPDDFKLATNQEGVATVAWYPDMQAAFCYAEISDKHWIIESSKRDVDKLDVIARRAVERRKISGRVLGSGKFAGGFNIKLGSFQAEQEEKLDYVYSFTDANGNFSADVLPDATYAVFLEDKNSVANATDLIPFESKTGQENPLELFLSQGIPVRITLTQGSDRKPISDTWVNIESNHSFTWLDDGRGQSGSLGSNKRAYSNYTGVIEMLAPEGELEASVYLPGWQAKQKIDVRRGESNEIHFHRKADQRVEVTGRIVPWKKDQQQIAGATVHIQAIDGESGDEFRFVGDEEGSFRIETNAAKLGAIAYSPDKRFIGTLVIMDFTKPALIQLHPTKSFSGKITDQAGNPVANHLVWASTSIKGDSKSGTTFPTTFSLPRIEVQTDSEGNYRFDGLPCQTGIRLETNTLEINSNSSEAIDEVYYLPDDEPRSKVTKIGKSTSRNKSLPLADRFALMLRDARLGSYHLMVIVYDKSEEPSREFIDKYLLDYSEHEAVASYMQLQVDAKELSEGNNEAVVDRLDWPKATQGVLAYAYDTSGKELGRIRIDPETPDAAVAAYKFIERHGPAQEDAEAKWNNAFQRAKEQSKLVWVRIGQRYCGPCFKLSRWIDDQREILEKDFILLKIDNVRDLNGLAISQRLTMGRSVGVPFHAIFDANEELLADSFGPLGNIGSISGLEGKRHFKKMLDAGCSKMTSQEIQVLLDTLED